MQTHRPKAAIYPIFFKRPTQSPLPTLMCFWHQRGSDVGESKIIAFVSQGPDLDTIIVFLTTSRVWVWFVTLRSHTFLELSCLKSHSEVFTSLRLPKQTNTGCCTKEVLISRIILRRVCEKNKQSLPFLITVFLFSFGWNISPEIRSLKKKICVHLLRVVMVVSYTGH